MLNEDRTKVFVVENEPSRRLLYRKHLESAGYWVVEANRAREFDPVPEGDGDDILSAEQQIQSHFFHASVIDLSLDVQNDPHDRAGFDVLLSINEREEKTKSIIITGYGTKDDILEAWKKRGAYHYLDKPNYSQQELLERVKGAVKEAKLSVDAMLRSQLSYSGLIHSPSPAQVRDVLKVGSGEDVRSVVEGALRPYFPFDSHLRPGSFHDVTIKDVQYSFLVVSLWSRYLGAGIELRVGSKEACDWYAIIRETGGKREGIDFVLYQVEPRDKVAALVEYMPELKIESFAQSSDDQDEFLKP